jgi:hypothetical protein
MGILLSRGSGEPLEKDPENLRAFSFQPSVFSFFIRPATKAASFTIELRADS